MSEELVVRFFAALEDGDIDTLREIYADLAPVAVIHGKNSPNPGLLEVCPGRDLAVRAPFGPALGTLGLHRGPIGRGVQWAGATERHQRVVARIVPALHADHPDGARHVGADDGNDALRGRHRVHVERRCQPLDRRDQEIDEAPDQRKQDDGDEDHRRVRRALANLYPDLAA